MVSQRIESSYKKCCGSELLLSYCYSIPLSFEPTPIMTTVFAQPSLARQNKLHTQKFTRHRSTLFGRAKDLVKLCGANIYILIQRKGKTFVFNSKESEE